MEENELTKTYSITILAKNETNGRKKLYQATKNSKRKIDKYLKIENRNSR